MSEKSDELEEAELDLYQEKVEWLDKPVPTRNHGYGGMSMS